MDKNKAGSGQLEQEQKQFFFLTFDIGIYVLRIALNCNQYRSGKQLAKLSRDSFQRAFFHQSALREQKRNFKLDLENRERRSLLSIIAKEKNIYLSFFGEKMQMLFICTHLFSHD